MINKIAFTGMSNIINSNQSYIFKVLVPSENDSVSFLDLSANKISLRLNNNGDQDLKNMQDVLNKYKDPRGLDFLQLERTNYDGINNSYFLNGKSFDVCRENLGFFSKIQKLLGKIQKEVKSSDIKNDYYASEDINNDIYLTKAAQTKILEMAKTNRKEIEQRGQHLINELSERYGNVPMDVKYEQHINPMKDCVDFELTKKTARIIENSIQKTMEKFFGIL